jgi:peptide deformylase
MAVKEILRLGNPTLRMKCGEVKQFGADEVKPLVDDLRDTLYDFRERNGFGRGIAAPQIGVTQRVIFTRVDEPLALINPVIVKRSVRQMTLWDDCFSFPDLLVKLNRNLSIEVRYQDEEGKECTLAAEGGFSELLQHEIDHLNGVLAIDRAVASQCIVYRAEYEKWLKNVEAKSETASFAG